MPWPDGNFLAHTNVYQIGLVVWTLMTMHPRLKPGRGRLEGGGGNRIVYNRDAQGFPATDPPLVDSSLIWERDNPNASALRLLSLRCLAWQPQRRPKLDELLKDIIALRTTPEEEGEIEQPYLRPAGYTSFEIEFLDLYAVGTERPSVGEERQRREGTDHRTRAALALQTVPREETELEPVRFFADGYTDDRATMKKIRKMYVFRAPYVERPPLLGTAPTLVRRSARQQPPSPPQPTRFPRAAKAAGVQRRQATLPPPRGDRDGTKGRRRRRRQ